MKLAIVSDFNVPHYNGGGERRYYEILTQLVKDGYHVDMYCMKIKNVPNKENMDGVNVYHVGPCIKSVPDRSLLQMIRFAIGVFFKLLFKKYDHYEAQGVGIMSLVMLRIFKRIKYSVVIHDLSTGKEDQWFGVKKDRFEKFLYKLPTQTIITVSNKVKERLVEEYNIKRQRIVTVHNGVNPDTLDSVSEQDKENAIIYVGRLVPHKHVQELMLAMYDIDAKLKIVGSGPEKENLERLKNQVKFGDKIHFIGNLDEYKDVIKEIKSSKILVLPSTREGFGMVLVEAMYCGVPVIAYKSDGPKEILINNQTGILMDDYGVETINENIKELLDDKETYEHLRINGKKLVHEKYTWQHTINKLVRVYEKG